MRLGALDSLQRGLENLRANWQLILLGWLQIVLTVAISVAALLPFYFVLDLRLPSFGDPEALSAWTITTLENLVAQLAEPAFWMAVLSSSAIFVAALACTSFFQAGTYGILVAGDRRAPSPRAEAASAFRAFSWREFQARGGRHLWPFFWLYNLILLLWTLWMLLVVLLVAAAAVTGQRAGWGAGLAIGCSGSLPILFLCFLFAIWALLAQVEIASRDAGAWGALRASLGVVVRRLPGMGLLFLLFFAASFLVAFVFGMVSFPLNAGLSPFPVLRRTFGMGLEAVQILVSVALQLVLAATAVALYRSEVSLEAAG